MEFSNYKAIETKRLTLRLITHNDIVLTYKLRSNPEVCKYIARPLLKNREEAKAHLDKVLKLIAKNESIIWVISKKHTNETIGTICLWNFSKDRKTTEVGYDSLPKFQGNGYMTEALMAILNFGFAFTIEAYTSKYNIKSIKLLEKHNFKLQKHRIDKDNPDNTI